MPKRSMLNFHILNLHRLTLVFIFVLIGFGQADAQNIQADSRLDRVSIPIGGQTLLHVSARMPLKTLITFPQLVDSIGKVQLVKSLKADTAIDPKNPNFETVTHSYAVTSFDAGVYTLPQFTFRTKTDSFKTGTVTLQVKAVPVDTTKTFYDIKQPLAVSYTFWDWLKDHWLAVLITLGLILLIGGIVYYYKNRPKIAAPIMAAPVLSADQIALNKLNELRNKKLWQQDQVKLYYSELTDILREYLEKRYHVKAHEQTTDELVESLQNKEIPQENSTKLRQLLTLADLVKFAKQKPQALENEQSMDEAINFIQQTKHQPEPITQKEEPIE
ncbi:MAG: hypothetical protein ACRYFL_14070 [Janthinobacterium lividum]